MCESCWSEQTYWIVNHVANADRVEVVPEQRILNPLCTIGRIYLQVLLTYERWISIACGARSCSPIPVRNTEICRCSYVFVSSSTSRERRSHSLNMCIKSLLRDISKIVLALLEQYAHLVKSQIWSVPWKEKVRSVSAVAAAITRSSANSIPRQVGSSVNSCHDQSETRYRCESLMKTNRQSDSKKGDQIERRS